MNQQIGVADEVEIFDWEFNGKLNGRPKRRLVARPRNSVTIPTIVANSHVQPIIDPFGSPVVSLKVYLF
jgi:hypothetical protein